jgi:hypothetical protein
MSYLDKLKVLKKDTAPMVLIYGQTKVGKTTLALEFPNPVFIEVDEGENENFDDVQIPGWGLDEVSCYADLIDAVQSLYNDDHEFETLVIDTLTVVERFIHEETCARGNEKGEPQDTIGRFGYGKGPVFANAVWNEFLDHLHMLRKCRGVTIVLIAHAAIGTAPDPETEDYQRFHISLEKKAQLTIEARMDAILMVREDVVLKNADDKSVKANKTIRAEKSSKFIYCDRKPTQVSGSRLGIPAKIPYRIGHGYAALAPYLEKWKQPAQPVAATQNKE